MARDPVDRDAHVILDRLKQQAWTGDAVVRELHGELSVDREPRGRDHAFQRNCDGVGQSVDPQTSGGGAGNVDAGGILE